MMERKDLGENCELMRYLAQVSMLDGDNRKAEYAGVLLYGLGNMNFTPQLPDITFTSQFVQHIAEDSQTNLLSEVVEKCLHCPQSSSCNIAALFKVG